MDGITGGASPSLFLDAGILNEHDLLHRLESLSVAGAEHCQNCQWTEYLIKMIHILSVCLIVRSYLFGIIL